MPITNHQETITKKSSISNNQTIWFLFLGYFLVIVSCFLYLAGFVNAQAVASPDAIAIRVIPNPSHRPAAAWYKAQGFAGSPQAVEVDGYSGVRDGRTVYVNAANIANGTLYTNIYLISYSQNAQNSTTDIFAAILSRWKFNTNADQPGLCELATSTACLLDADCPLNDFCRSDKAAIRRDTQRLEDIALVRARLSAYRQKTGRFPALSAGSYLSGKSLSVWPSWQKVLAQDLGAVLPEDPVNRLGACGSDSFNPITCWDENQKRFADANAADPAFNLPQNSRSYLYEAGPQGQSYVFCGIMESGFVQGVGNGACAQSAQFAISEILGNNPPELGVQPALRACSDYPFSAYLSARDPDDDVLVWTIDTAPSGQWAGWSGAPQLFESPRPDSREIRASAIGPAGNYSFSVSVSDGHGGSDSRTVAISVGDCRPPRITRITNNQNGQVLYSAQANTPLPFIAAYAIGGAVDWTVEADDPEGNYPLSFVFSDTPHGFSASGALLPNNHDYHVQGTLVDRTGRYLARLSARDSTGVFSSPLVFSLSLSNRAPAFTSSPPLSARACVPYDYALQAADPDGHNFEFLAYRALPAALSLNSGRISGHVRIPGVYPVSLLVRDQYYGLTQAPDSAQGQQNYSLTVSPENFGLTLPPNGVFYDIPTGVDPAHLYRLPTSYIAQAQSNAALGATWNMSSPALPLGVAVSVSGSGQITALSRNANPPAGGFAIPLTLRARNTCGESHEGGFSLTLRRNEWCGDGIVQIGDGETCDNNDIDNDNVWCTDNCPDEYNPLQEDLDRDGIGDFCDCCYNLGGSCLNLRITQGSWSRDFSVFAMAQSPADFYCYDGRCANPQTTYQSSSNLAEAYNFAASGRSNIFGYYNSLNNMVSLGFLHDQPVDGSGGSARMTFAGSGWTMATLSVSDDNNEFTKADGGDWTWGECCTDGGMIDVADPNMGWSMTIDPASFVGINNWSILTPCSTIQIPDISSPITVRRIP